MKNLIKLFLILIVVVQNGFSQSGWFQIYPSINTQNRNFHSVYAIENVIFASGDEFIIKSTNAGLTWDSLYLNSTWGTRFKDLFFLDINTGFVVMSDSANILKTTNGGINWQFIRVTNIENVIALCIFMLNPNTGYVGLGLRSMSGVSSTQKIFKTTNGGTNWTGQDVGNNSNQLQVKDLHFLNEATGYAAASGFILKTTNGGLDYYTIGSSYIYSPALSVNFRNVETGFITSNNGKIYRTSNGGGGWYEHQLVNWIGTIWNINFTDSATGYLVGDNAIFKTTNTGVVWTRQTNPSNTYAVFYSISFLNQNTGFTVGFDIYTNSVGVIWKTTNGGEPIGIKKTSNIIPNENSLYQNYPNPFNPQTTIKFDISKTTYAKLIIYDINGREITVLFDENMNAGKYQIDLNVENLTTGVYFYQLITNNYRMSKKMLIIK